MIANKGAGGIDGMTVDELLKWYHDNGEQLKESLINGTYKPSPVRGVKIPKPGSWLNVAEIELSLFTTQCLDRRMPDMATPYHDPSDIDLVLCGTKK